MNIRKVLEAKGSAAFLTIPGNATLAEFVKQACERNIGAMAVIDKSSRLVGILSERDVLHQCNRRADFNKVTVAEVMTKNVVSVGPDDDINMAMDLMIAKRIRHLPVISGAKIEGIITIRDLIHAMRKADQDELRCFVDYLQTQVETAGSAQA